jgi:hypothetical protein
MRHARQTIVAEKKQKELYILSVSAALVIQHSNGMRRIILSSVACRIVPYFYTFIS